MFKSGLYINDLSMHDSSRDLVLAGTQQSAELKLALDQVSGAASNSYPPLTTIRGGSVKDTPYLSNISLFIIQSFGYDLCPVMIKKCLALQYVFQTSKELGWLTPHQDKIKQSKVILHKSYIISHLQLKKKILSYVLLVHFSCPWIVL